MRSHYKNVYWYKNQPFYNSEIKSNKKKNKKNPSKISLLSELPVFSKESKEPKDLTIKQLSEALPFYPPKRKQRSKRLTKYQIFSNVLSFFLMMYEFQEENALLEGMQKLIILKLWILKA